MQSLVLSDLLQAWANDCKEMRNCLEDHIEGIPTSWHIHVFVLFKVLMTKNLIFFFDKIISIPYYHPKAQKYFGDKKITGSTKEEVMNQVQPTLDELRVHIMEVLRGTLVCFVNGTYPYFFYVYIEVVIFSFIRSYVQPKVAFIVRKV
jgi:hypothetical protein